MQSINKSPFLVSALCLALAACGGSGSSGGTSPAPTPSPGTGSGAIAQVYQGTWIAEAYGRVLEIGSDTARLLDYTSEFCLTVFNEPNLNTADIEGLFRLRDDQLEWYASAGTAAFGAPGTRFDAASSLPPSCQNGTTPIAGESGYSRDARRDLTLMAQIIQEYSIYPELRGIDVQALLEDQLHDLSTNSDDEAIAEALFQLVSPFADIHATVETDVGLVKVLNKPSFVDRLFAEWLSIEGLTPPISNAEVAQANVYIGEQLDLDRAITLSYANSDSDIQRAANDLLTWFVVDGIGYLAIDAMIGFGNSEDTDDELAALEVGLDRAMQDLRDAQALVVDVRRNGGGRDFLSLAIASRFVANETLAYSKQARLGSGRTELIDIYLSPRGAVQFLNPVFVLTSNETASAAEVFTLAMRALPNVILVGEATQGGLSDQLDKSLTNGWPASVANEYYLSPEGELFETTGIPVDFEIPQFSLQARQAETDLGLEGVIEALEN